MDETILSAATEMYHLTLFRKKIAQINEIEFGRDLTKSDFSDVSLRLFLTDESQPIAYLKHMQSAWMKIKYCDRRKNRIHHSQNAVTRKTHSIETS
jgi:hypothetical protein